MESVIDDCGLIVEPSILSVETNAEAGEVEILLDTTNKTIGLRPEVDSLLIVADETMAVCGDKL